MAIPTIIFQCTKYHYFDKKNGNSYYIVEITNNKTEKTICYELSGDNLESMLYSLLGGYENVRQFAIVNTIDISAREYNRMIKNAEYAGCTAIQQIRYLQENKFIPDFNAFTGAKNDEKVAYDYWHYYAYGDNVASATK